MAANKAATAAETAAAVHLDFCSSVAAWLCSLVIEREGRGGGGERREGLWQCLMCIGWSVDDSYFQELPLEFVEKC